MVAATPLPTPEVKPLSVVLVSTGIGAAFS
jgi:hypothetical protein